MPRKGRAASKAATEKIANNVKVNKASDSTRNSQPLIMCSLNVDLFQQKMYFLIACLKELSNLGAKKRRPDDDDEAAKKDAPPPAKRATRSRK